MIVLLIRFIIITSHDGTSDFKTTSDTSDNDETLDSSRTSFTSQSPTASDMGASGSKIMKYVDNYNTVLGFHKKVISNLYNYVETVKALYL